MSKSFPSHWDILPFLDAVSDVTVGNSTLRKQQYLEMGEYPVIGQGQSLISGYTNNASLLAAIELPCIAFGEHTRVFKYLEQPFCLGSDGVKLLEPIAKLDKKFLYYYLTSLNIESAGYSRHFNYLKERMVPIPPAAEQKRIVSILDKADSICKKREQTIEKTDRFLRSVFLEMFGDPITNPKKWQVVTLADIGTLERGRSLRQSAGESKLLGDTYPLIRSRDVVISRGYISSYSSNHSEQKILQSLVWPTGTLCITTKGNIAKTGVLTFDACLSDDVAGFKVNNRATVEYVQYCIGFLQRKLEATVPEAVVKNLSISLLRDLEIPLPADKLQADFSAIIKKALFVINKRNSFESYSLFDSLSQKAFSGQL